MPVFHGCASKTIDSATPGAPPEIVREKMTAAAFEFDDDQLLWMSDVNEIPDTTWQLFKQPQSQAVIPRKIKDETEDEYDSGFDDDAADVAVTAQIVRARPPAADVSMAPLSISQTADHYKLVIMDGTNLKGEAAHHGIADWIRAGLRLRAHKMILVQIEHAMSYGELCSLGLEIQGDRPEGQHDEFIDQVKRLCSGQPGLWEECLADGFWVRPGFDGQRFRIQPDDVPFEY